MRTDASERTQRAGRRRAVRVGLPVAVVVAGLVASLVAAPSPAGGQGVDPTTTTVPTASGSGSATTRPAGPATPSGQVAYATADGRVWVGDGLDTPVEVAQGAAVGRGDQAAIAVSPTADVVAFIRADGSLAIVPITGGTPTVLATDAVTTSIGRDPSIAWSATGDRIAYLATGTEAMVPPKPATAPELSDPNVFRMPMPQGVLGNVVKVVDRAGLVSTTIGDPSVRSYVGVTASPADDLMILDSVVPGTRQRYTLVAATSGLDAETPTLFSADDAAFAPDGRFIVAVGPAKGRKELIRISTDTLERVTLVTEDDICGPSISPDGTRIAFGAGENCSRLQLVPANGGRVVDVTPPETPDTTTFGVVGEIGWTVEARFVTHADCRSDAGRIDCDGPTMFLDPDTGRLFDGPAASTISPIRRPLVQDVYVDIHLRGPLEFKHSFLIDPQTQGELTEIGETGGLLQGRLTDGGTVMEVKLQVVEGKPWATGLITITDPESGINRSFAVLARANVIGVRVFSLSGVWYSTEDLPFATGKFNLAVRRR